MDRLKIVLALTTLLTLLLSAQVQAGWKLQELARGSNALLVEMDLLLAHKKTSCKFDAPKVSEYSQNLKILVDARAAELKNSKDQKARKDELVAMLKTCKNDCTCDTYEYALEKITESESYSTTNKLSAQQRLACVKKQPPFCQSKLFRALK